MKSVGTSLTSRNPAVPLSKNDHLLRWVEKMAELTRPARIHWVDGSEEERDRLCGEIFAECLCARRKGELGTVLLDETCRNEMIVKHSVVVSAQVLHVRLPDRSV